MGIWHETYLVPAGAYDCVYNNMPPIGLGEATRLVPATGRKATAAARAGFARRAIRRSTHRGDRGLMAKLIYAAITSLDGYVADEEGRFDWAEPDEEVHSFVNELERPIGTHLYGRRMREVLRYWQDPDDLDAQPSYIKDYGDLAGRGQGRLLQLTRLASTPRTRLEPEFDPAAVRDLEDAADADLGVGGPTLAAEALRAGLVDELHQFLNPVVVGGGTAWLPAGLRFELELLDERRFAGGVVHLHYRTST